MASEQQGAEEREAELAKVFKRMGRAARRGDVVRYEELKAEHDRLKAEHVVLSHEEQRAEARARRAAQRAQEVRERPRAWRLPSGFSSPLARERARSGRPREEPSMPEGGLRPWRRYGSPASEVIWRPGG